jgi:hypothetical protein
VRLGHNFMRASFSWRMRCFALTTTLLLLQAENADASWLSKITGIDINIPAGTISFDVPRPDAIPDMIKNHL